MTDQREPWPQWTSKGAGEPCPRCKRPMERRQRDRPPAWFSGYWHTEWGHCGVCPYQVFYPGFERRQDYLANWPPAFRCRPALRRPSLSISSVLCRRG